MSCASISIVSMDLTKCAQSLMQSDAVQASSPIPTHTRYIMSSADGSLPSRARNTPTRDASEMLDWASPRQYVRSGTESLSWVPGHMEGCSAFSFFTELPQAYRSYFYGDYLGVYVIRPCDHMVHVRYVVDVADVGGMPKKLFRPRLPLLLKPDGCITNTRLSPSNGVQSVEFGAWRNSHDLVLPHHI